MRLALLQGWEVMRTCRALLGSDRALRNPRARVGWGGREAGNPPLCSLWAPATSSHRAGLSGTHCRVVVGQETSGQPRVLAETAQGCGFQGSPLAPLPAPELGWQKPPSTGTPAPCVGSRRQEQPRSPLAPAEGTGQTLERSPLLSLSKMNPWPPASLTPALPLTCRSAVISSYPRKAAGGSWAAPGTATSGCLK